MTSRPALAILVGLALATAAGGCDWFRPAQPEAPSSETSFIPDYSRPDSTLATIARAVADKGHTLGATAYEAAFAESVTTSSPAAYRQFFSDQDVAVWLTQHSGVPDWGFREEQKFYSRFIRLRPDGYQVEWAKDDLNPDVESEGIFYRHYLVTAHAEDGTLTQYLAIGYAKLEFRQFPDGAWRIARWEDRIDPQANAGDPEQVTWGRRRLTTPQ